MLFVRLVQLLNRKLVGLQPSERPRLGTVETMQGQSVEVVLISLATSEPAYLGAVDGFYFLSNRWNVAISRARTKVVVMGSEDEIVDVAVLAYHRSRACGAGFEGAGCRESCLPTGRRVHRAGHLVNYRSRDYNRTEK